MRQTRKQAFNASELIPIMCEEVLPGDTWQHKENIVARLATPIAPILDDLDLETFYFFVPNRILWDGWEDFITGTDTTSTMPGIVPATAGPVNEVLRTASSITSDCCRAPTPAPDSESRTYPSSDTSKSGTNGSETKTCRTNGLQRYLQQRLQLPDHPRRHTMGSNAAPHQQTPRLLHKLTSVAAKRDGRQPAHYGQRTSHTNHHGRQSRKTILHQRSHRQYQPIPNDRTGGVNAQFSGAAHTGTDPMDWAITGLEADMAAVTATTINNIRLAFQTQRLLERDARGGSRYVEQTLSHFGVRTPDYRLQRPEYLGGSKIPIAINPIAQTATYDAEPADAAIQWAIWARKCMQAEASAASPTPPQSTATSSDSPPSAPHQPTNRAPEDTGSEPHDSTSTSQCSRTWVNKP